MSDGEQAFPEICPKLLEFSRYLGITWNAQALAGTFRIILYIKRLLLDAGGMGRCHIVVKRLALHDISRIILQRKVAHQCFTAMHLRLFSAISSVLPWSLENEIVSQNFPFYALIL